MELFVSLVHRKREVKKNLTKIIKYIITSYVIVILNIGIISEGSLFLFFAVLCICVLELTVTLSSVALFTLPLQFVGYSDEVLDVKFLGKGDSHIVVATNSCQLKVFELLTNSCQILYGHTGESPAEGSVCVCLHVETPTVCVFMYSKLQSRDMHVSLNGVSKLAVGLIVSVQLSVSVLSL